MPSPTPDSPAAASPARRRVVLDPHPQSASRARKVVAELLATCRLDGLVETAELLVSELVTNAVLHAATPVDLRCQVEGRVLWVEVGDRSPTLPGRRHYDDDALTGRGLGLVDMLAAAWGVEGSQAGKSVWFQLAVDGKPLAQAPPSGRGDWTGDQFDVHFINLPPALVLTAVQHGDSVLRELALGAMSAQPDQAAPTWQASRIDLGPTLDAVATACQQGLSTVDMTVSMPAGAGAAAFQRLSLVEEADRMARDGLLLSPPSIPEIMACRRWLLSQIGLQEEGTQPQAWKLPSPLAPSRQPAELTADQRHALDAITTGAIVADDGNQIIYVNDAAATMLGWPAGDLLGHRLLSIVPPEHREAHLAGFGRYLITSEPRLIGQPVNVPALQADGTRADIELTLEVLDVGDGRVAFLARLK